MQAKCNCKITVGPTSLALHKVTWPGHCKYFAAYKTCCTLSKMELWDTAFVFLAE